MYTPNFVIVDTKKSTTKKLAAINELNNIKLKEKAIIFGAILVHTALYAYIVVSEMKSKS